MDLGDELHLRGKQEGDIRNTNGFLLNKWISGTQHCQL